MTCVAVSRTRREARAGTIRTETTSPTAQPSPTSRTRSTAKPNGPKVDPLMPNNTRMAVIGATRKPAERAAMNDRGATATTRAAARDSPCSCGIANATALPYMAPNTDPMKRSSATLSEPPTLLWVTIKAVITAQNPCGSARAWAKAKAPKLDTVIRRVCTTFDPWRSGSRQPITALVLAAGAFTLTSTDTPATQHLMFRRGLWHRNVMGPHGYVVAPLNGWTLCNRLVPALHVRVLVEIDSHPRC